MSLTLSSWNAVIVAVGWGVAVGRAVGIGWGVGVFSKLILYSAIFWALASIVASISISSPHEIINSNINKIIKNIFYKL